jgi:hypothetical protein
MKKTGYLILAVLAVALMTSCEKDSKSLITKSETISLGAGYANDIYYRLSDGLVTPVPRATWDIAFCVSSREAAILTNGGSGVVLKAYPITPNWTWADAIDTAGYYAWTALTNSDTTWAEGAFNMNATGHPNYGWGVYNEVTHNLSGVSLYIITTRNGEGKKIWIDSKLSVDQKYSFKYADLDGGNEQVVNLDLAGINKNFVYYSLETNEEVNREPDIDKWDIVFTKYVDNSINYIVTGVLQNIGVTALESTDVDPLSEVMPDTGYLTAMSTIGSDWKTFSMDTFQYTIDETRVFYVRDQNEKIYRIRFTSFEGSTTGNLSFDVSTLE